jgi:hypothetical protein
VSDRSAQGHFLTWTGKICRGVALAGEPSPLGRHLPEVVSLTAAHGHEFARLFIQETPPGKDGDEVAP